MSSLAAGKVSKVRLKMKSWAHSEKQAKNT